MIPVISIVGRSDSGKTTYLEKVIRELKTRGYRVATVKHDVHGFEMDQPGKDTWRHAQAGADVVCISSTEKMAMIKKVGQELALDDVLAYITDVDIVFTEGYKQERKQKIEIYRKAVCDTPLCPKSDLLAIATDTHLYDDIPQFSLDDAGELALFLEAAILKPNQ